MNGSGFWLVTRITCSLMLVLGQTASTQSVAMPNQAPSTEQIKSLGAIMLVSVSSVIKISFSASEKLLDGFEQVALIEAALDDVGTRTGVGATLAIALALEPGHQNHGDRTVTRMVANPLGQLES